MPSKIKGMEVIAPARVSANNLKPTFSSVKNTTTDTKTCLYMGSVSNKGLPLLMKSIKFDSDQKNTTQKEGQGK
jgi:hypothetical protein